MAEQILQVADGLFLNSVQVFALATPRVNARLSIAQGARAPRYVHERQVRSIILLAEPVIMKVRTKALLLLTGIFLVAVSGSSASALDPLVSAVRAGDLAAAQRRLTEAPNAVNEATGDEFHPTVVFIAIEKEDTNMLALLVRNGADLNVPTRWHRTAIDEAVWTGKSRAFSWWLSISPASNQVQRAFDLAITPKDLQSDIWKLILQNERAVLALKGSGVPYIARVLQVRKSPNGPTMFADRVAVAKRLVELGFDADAPVDGKTAGDIAASNLDLEALRVVDRRHQYANLLKQFSHDVSSPFLGKWSNGKDNFRQRGLCLTTDGRDTMQGSTDTLPILWVEHGHALEVHLSFAEANGLSNPIMTGALSPDGNRIECKFRTMGQKDQADALNRKSQ